MTELHIPLVEPFPQDLDRTVAFKTTKRLARRHASHPRGEFGKQAAAQLAFPSTRATSQHRNGFKWGTTQPNGRLQILASAGLGQQTRDASGCPLPFRFNWK